MAERKVIIVIGIPGVGKTTLLSMVARTLKDKQKSISIVSYGTLMFDVAKQNGIASRDELRAMPIARQQDIQKITAEKIASMTDEILIIDTHAFIHSMEGYYPGLPENVLKIIKPTNFISVSAKPEEIYNRRMEDKTRDRDRITLSKINKELDIQSGMISACAVIAGSPVKHIFNSEGQMEHAAKKIIKAMGWN